MPIIIWLIVLFVAGIVLAKNPSMNRTVFWLIIAVLVTVTICILLWWLGYDFGDWRGPHRVDVVH